MNDVIHFDPKVFAGAKPADAFATLRPQDDKLSDGIGVSYPIIHITGGKWALTYQGDRKTFTRPDDGTPIGYLDVVILRKAPHKVKSWYPGGYDEQQSKGKRPDCYSRDGVKPDDDVVNKQADFCQLCPRNAFKVDPKDNKRRKECTDYLHLAVLIMPTFTQQLLGAPLMEPAFLRIPPDSMQSLARFGDELAKQGYHYSTYVTRLSFDPNTSHPKLMFRATALLGNAEAAVVLPLREDPQALRITGEDPSVAYAQATPAKSLPQSDGSLLNAAAGLVAAASNKVVELRKPAPEPKLAPEPEVVAEPNPSLNGSFGLVEAAQAPKPAPKQAEPVNQTVDDVGETDDETDALVESLLKTK